MDIWRWIDGLDEDVADSMYDLSAAVCDGHHNRVDSLVPMIVGMARERQLPWVEVFARHWELQSLIFHRYDPSSGLPKAVSLLERSHRDDAIDCPQTICVTQDVCAAYAMADGPGYAEERLAVAKETLDRISPAWTCWSCISAEQAAAMIDTGDCEAAIEFLEESERLIAKAGGDPDAIDMRRVKVEALRKLGRYEEGLELAQQAASDRYSGDSFLFECNALAMQMQARLSQFDEILEALPPVGEVLNHGRIDVHGDTLAHLVRGGAMTFDDERVRDFSIMVEHGIARGTFRMSAEVAVLAVELCAESGLSHEAGAFAELAGSAIRELRSGDDLQKQLDDATGKVAATDDDAPGAERWSELGFRQKALAITEAAYKETPEDLELFQRLAGLYLETNADEALRQFLDEASSTDEIAANVLWYRSFLLERTQGLDAAIEVLQELAAQRPDWRGTNWRLADLLNGAGRYEEALPVYNHVITLFEEAGAYDWDRMEVAARLGEHDAVRDSAARLGMELEGDSGPIDENWGGCLVHYRDDTYVFAIRTGPVTARIESLARYRVEERYKDELVIRPRPENPDAPDNEYWIYPHVDTLRTGGYSSFILDGVHPGEEMLNKMRETINGAGFAFEQKSGEQYQLQDPDSGESVTGLFARLGVPADGNLADAHKLLTELAADPGIRVLTWVDLLQQLGLEDEIKAQQEVAERWDF